MTENQIDWVGETAPFQAHSPTSIAAAAQIQPRLNKLQCAVLRCLQDHGRFGLTDEEMQLMLQMNPSTQRPRRIEIERKGLIYQEGTRKTRSGRSAAIWFLKRV